MNAPRRPPARPVSLLPDPRRGLASAVAVAGTGRLHRLHRALLGGPVRADRFGVVAGLDAGLVSLRRGGVR